MRIEFHKYQGTGNDFILIDNRHGEVVLNGWQVAALCDRRFGIGADGLMLLETEPEMDFRMVYYNSDGNLSSMCGNGGRCIVAFAKSLGIVNKRAVFSAADGMHEAVLREDGFVALKMKDVREVEVGDDFFFLDTGSPHYVKFVENVEQYDVFAEGKKIRQSERFLGNGCNVNFAERKDDCLFVRTYERGVEAETFSCGTGVTAAALVAVVKGMATGKNSCLVKTLGGELEVTFDKVLEHNFYNIWLRGPAMRVYTGSIELTEKDT